MLQVPHKINQQSTKLTTMANITKSQQNDICTQKHNQWHKTILGSQMRKWHIILETAVQNANNHMIT
jgi:hypothetical protein